jgi:hypothetical protein
MSNIRQWIEKHGDAWLDDLVAEYKIETSVVGDLVSLRYNQIESPMHEPIVQECRGMVVHLPSKEILAWPYNKFHNYGDRLAAEIDWSTASVLDKADGSLMILFWNPYVDQWQVASSGNPAAAGQVNDEGFTFAELFWKTFNESGMRLPGELYLYV